jgi:hypothetical protein
MIKLKPRPLAFLLALTVPCIAFADERESLESLRATTMGLIQALVQQGVLTQQKADEILRQAGVAGAAAASSAPGASAALAASSAPAGPAAPAAPLSSEFNRALNVRVPYVPEFVKRELREQIRDEVLAKAKEERWADPAKLPEWLDRFTFAGELTLRWEDDQFRKPCDAVNGVTSSCNDTPALYNSLTGTSLNNTNVNRQLLRLRAIEGATIKVNDHLQAEFRLSTGSASSPVTNFQTLGNSFTRPTIGLDRASISYQPFSWLALQGGRFGNPFFGSDLLWYDRLSFDGVAVNLHTPGPSPAQGFLTVGAFPLQDIEPSQVTDVKTKWMYGAQFGGSLHAGASTDLKSAVALYNYDHVQGVPNDATGNNAFNSLTVPQFLQKGNTLFNVNGLNGGTAQFALASKFRVLDWTTRLDLARWDPVHATLLVDVARNIGFDQNEILARTAGLGLDPQLSASGLTQTLQPRVRAYGTRFTLGKPRIAASGDWQLYAGYKYVQRDAVLDAFVDPDFHLGGTDAKGWVAGAGYGLDGNTWLTVKYLAAEPIDGPPLTIDVLQLDFNVRF